MLSCLSKDNSSKEIETKCTYELTPANYKEIRENCVGFFTTKHADEVIYLKNQDALLEANELNVSYEKIALITLLNDKSESYCFTIFGQLPSSSFALLIEEEDKLLDCNVPKILSISINKIESTPDDGYRVNIVYNCGLSGRCQSSWWVYVKEIEDGKLEVIKREVIWIT